MSIRCNAASVALAATLALPLPATAMDILITNDDGYTADGINILFNELVAAGHNVTMVAPKTNQSGKGMAFNSEVFFPVEVVNFAPNQWYVDGTPVDCLQAGLDAILVNNPPDIVVSGINFGENVGPISSQSGTVGAAQKALQRGVPAIAVSAQRDNSNSNNTINAMDDAAQFVIQVIDELIYAASERPAWCDSYPNTPFCQTEIGSIELPEGVGLNINHPPVEAANTAGVVFTRISNYTTVDFSIVENPPGGGVYFSQLLFNQTPPTAQEALEDVVQLNNGFITVSPLDPDLNALAINEYLISNALRNILP
jgi:5'/3'-nucleotidase SurE